jgi:DNA polymerase kappa
MHEATKDSDFYKQQLTRDAQIQEKIASMQVEIEQFFAQGEAHIRRFREEVEAKTAEIEGKRVLAETWIHVDMDMFYAAVEIRDDPSLKEKPVAVGGMNMVCTANYVARKFGVRSAMPGFIAKKLCPDLVFVGLHFDKYKEIARQVRDILKDYDPEYESMGLDEAHLWVTSCLATRGMDNDEGRQELAREIRRRIYETTQLTASAGIGPNKMLAKIGSDINKPDGQFYLPPDRDQILPFITSQNVRKIPGIGKVSEKILNELGITTCAQILEERLKLFAVFSPNSFEFFVASALGIGSTRHPTEIEDQKSISVSRTFRATEDIQQLEDMMRKYCKEVAEELQSKGGCFKTVTVFYKTAKFESKSK